MPRERPSKKPRIVKFDSEPDEAELQRFHVYRALDDGQISVASTFVRAQAADVYEHPASSEVQYDAQEAAEPNADISTETMTGEPDVDEGQQKHPSSVSSHYTSIRPQ